MSNSINFSDIYIILQYKLISVECFALWWQLLGIHFSNVCIFLFHIFNTLNSLLIILSLKVASTKVNAEPLSCNSWLFSFCKLTSMLLIMESQVLPPVSLIYDSIKNYFDLIAQNICCSVLFHSFVANCKIKFCSFIQLWYTNELKSA